MGLLDTLLKSLGSAGGGLPVLPPGCAYVDVEGTVWIAPELGGYFDNPTGEVSILLDTLPHEAQNVYFDRV